jgi:hypothetical protein
VLSEVPSGIVRSSARCKGQPYSWVCREGRDREKREDMLAKSADHNFMLSS